MLFAPVDVRMGPGMIRLQRLKDKLGNKSNASSEIEYEQAWAQRIGEEEGVATIIEMVHHTRLDCTLAAAGLMRQAFSQAVHHARHRQAFGASRSAAPDAKCVGGFSARGRGVDGVSTRVARAFDERTMMRMQLFLHDWR